LIPPWLVKEGRSIVVYDAKGNQITQTVGVAPKTPKVLGMGAAMPGQVGPVLECLTCRVSLGEIGIEHLIGPIQVNP
jgi:hypothetical protein